MTKKGKGRGKKTSISKQLQSSPGELNDPSSPESQEQSGQQQLDDSNVSELQNPVVLAQENARGLAEDMTNSGNVAQLHGPSFVASGEATTSFGSIERGENQEQQELEVGLNNIASYSKDIPVLSPLAAVFESKLNDIHNKNTKETTSRVVLTQNSTMRETREENTNELTRARDMNREATRENSRTVNQRENGAGVASSFDSQWAAKFRELEELENARKEELNKQMLDARLKLEREMNRAKVEHEIMMKKRNIEQQQAELRQLEEIYGDVAEPPDRVSGSRHDVDHGVTHHSQPPQNTTISDRSYPNATQDNSFQLQHLLEKQQHTMDEVVKGLRMPQREYMNFYGEPRDFPLFMRNFEVNVETKEDNDADRLNYLIQYCKGPARQAIEHCVIMPPEEGYIRAKEILRKNFGRNHIVTQAFLDKVISGLPIRVNEAERLAQLARDMETCLLGSTQLGNGANINSIDTLGKVIGRLPIHLRSKWAERANQLYENHITPNFSHLTEFVQSRAAVANTYFGQIVNSKSEQRKDGTDKGKKKITIL